ncbi:MAG: hypothetical protein E6I47_12745 [Chloroflexi bacterium]|nr:MAG: hypothetical protein E6I47_12745 [Chloroflexota bacterium]
MAYFYGCWVNYNDRRLGERAVAILERNGIEVVVPHQQCCGIPAVVNSNMDLARRYGQQNVRNLTPVAEEMDIVASSTSCGLMLKHDYGHLLDIPGSERLGAKTYDGIGYPAMRLLRLIPGVKLEEVDEGCCGISGTFGVKVEKYDLSMKIGSRLFAAVKAAGTDAVLADCETCRMQVEHGAGAHSAHPIDILARAYGHG